MAKKIKASKLKDFPLYKVTSNFNDSGMLKGAKDGAYHKTDDKDKHFKVANDGLSFDVQPRQDDPSTMLLMLDSPGSTEKILYLPYRKNCITSIVIPTDLDTSVKYFFTEKLSGCNIFIDKRQNGDLVCYHANAFQHSLGESAGRGDPAATIPAAEEAMADMHKNAQESGFPVVKSERLQASDYYKKPKEEVERQRKKKNNNPEFSGGTNFMGFREKDGWEFWLQTYGRITNDNEDTGKAAKDKVFEARRFWP